MGSFWLVIFMILLLIELCTVNLVSIWFAIGALGGVVAATVTNNVTIQVIVFIVVSIISLLITKPIVKKIRTRKITPTNLDRVIGKEGLVTKEISKNSFGEVKIGGCIWTATSKEKIEKDTQVKVLQIEGVKLVVEKIKEDE